MTGSVQVYCQCIQYNRFCLKQFSIHAQFCQANFVLQVKFYEGYLYLASHAYAKLSLHVIKIRYIMCEKRHEY